MKTTLLCLAAVVATTALTACGGDLDAHSDPFARLQAIEVDDAEAAGIVRVANEVSQTVLDVDIGLDARAAYNIVHRREVFGEFKTLAEVDAVAYVGESALEKLRAWALSEGYVTPAGVPGTVVNGVIEGSYVGLGILAVANQADLATLDDAVGLDARAAAAIDADRAARGPFRDLGRLDALPYVGVSAFSKLAAHAEAVGLLPGCGDGIVQAFEEACDGTPDCDETCELAPFCGDGTLDDGEACDDGNAIGGDGCDASCAIEWVRERDNWANASAFSPEEAGTASYFQGSTTDNDVDYWAITVEEDSHVAIDLWLFEGEGCVRIDGALFAPDIRLLDANRRTITTINAVCGRHDGPDLEIGLAAGRYFLRIEGQDVGNGWDYDFPFYTADYKVDFIRTPTAAQ
ncbi:MAG: hypothetical protein R3F60_10310 [bacterium]